MTLRIGIHPNNLHLSLLHGWPERIFGDDIVFVPYPEGRDSGTLLAAGDIDLCGTGSTPPILAQAAGLDVQYVAASAPRPANSGLVVGPHSNLTTVAALRGRRVALIDGSFHTYLLARVLDQAGLTLRDVVRVEMRPGASLHALQTGDVAAWVAMAPLFDQAVAAGTVRVLARCGDTIPNRSVFWTLRRRRLSAGTLAGLQDGLVRLGQAISSDPDQAARQLAASNATPADLTAWRSAVTSRDWAVVPAGPAIIAEQQNEADTLLRHGDLEHAVDLSAAA